MLARLAAVGADLRDDEQTRQNKGLLVLITILVLPIGVVWGCLYLIVGSWVGYVPLVYALILLSAIVAFIRTRSLALLLRVNLIAILLAPTLSMIPLGGFLPSGAVGMWGVLAPVGALVFSGPRAGLRWYVAYLAVFIGSGVAGQIAGPVSTVPEWFTSIMLGLNVAVAGSIVFILLATFLGQRDRAMGENARLFLTVRRQSQELSRFLSPQVAALVTSEEGAKLLEGHRRQISVIFCDLRGFTTFSETVEPEEVLGVLRQHQAAMGELIVKYGGTLEHFAGDGMMVFFNDPVLMEGHERVAVRLAVAMRDRFADLALGWKQKGYALGLGIGVASGYATLGRIGFEGRYDYGAVGNVVILASRLSTEARPGQILVSQRVHAAVETDVETVPLGDLSLKGMTRPVPAFDVVAAR